MTEPRQSFGDLASITMEERKALVDEVLTAQVNARIEARMMEERAKLEARKAYDRETDSVLDIVKRGKAGDIARANTPITTISFYAPKERKEVNLKCNPMVAAEDSERDAIKAKKSRCNRNCIYFCSTLLLFALIAVNILWP